ncbi:molecular chaperone HtpG [Nisaea sp.]|uniref:molecular chaperone HtpG n=1 Tax=Nisaea sp. TaxID=2024842 RepID=UPI003B519EBF
MTAEKRTFQAEVSKLLKIVANSLYSEREVFLRELISNASDACDKLRYLALTNPDLTTGDGEFKIKIAADKEAGTLTLSDNGIGMSAEELNDNLGTIARSGTEAFVSNLSGDEKKDAGLIGQFGVGFYSAFMVADKVEVLTKRAGETKAHLWSSDGLGEYTVSDAEKANRGTIITMHLKEDALEFLEEQRLQHIVKRYSDHIPVPILFIARSDGGEEEKPLNEASALWTRPKSEITEEQYKEFYHHAAHAFDDPWATLHWKAEGVIEYSSLLYVPTQRPFDLFHPERKNRVKLYVKRVFITDDCEGLVPEYLRFLRGVIDCEDLPLNVSRELLQRNPVLQKISSAVTKRVLSELSKKAEKEPEEYAKFWDAFGPVMKEGLYADGTEHRETLLSLVRFRTTESDKLVSLKDYAERMKEGQEAIYYIIGESPEALLNSPHLEGFRAKGVEVLLLTDPIDDFWLQAMFEGYEGKPFKSITRGSADLDAVKGGADDKPEDAKKDEEAKQDAGAEIAPLIASLKLALGEAVKDVRESKRLTDSPVCLIADEGDMDINLERLLRQHKQLEKATPRVLEINARHAVIKTLAKRVKAGKTGQELEDAAYLLLDQARIMEGEAVPDPKAFARRLAMAMERGLAV